MKTQVAGSAEPCSRPGTGRRWRGTQPAPATTQRSKGRVCHAPPGRAFPSRAGAVGARSVTPGHCKGHNYLQEPEAKPVTRALEQGGCGLRRGLRRSLRPLTNTSFSLGAPGRGRRSEPAWGFLCFSPSLPSPECRVCLWVHTRECRPGPGGGAPQADN